MTPTNLSDLYSSSENTQLQTLQSAYNQAMAAYQSEIVKNSAAKAGHQTIFPTQPGGPVYFSNSAVNNGAPITPGAYQNWIDASDALIPQLHQIAVDKNTDLATYTTYLENKYELAFNNANPELAQNLAQIDSTTQLGTASIEAQAAVSSAAAAAQAKTEGELAAEAQASKNKIILLVVVGVVVAAVIAVVIYFWKKSSKPESK